MASHPSYVPQSSRQTFYYDQRTRLIQSVETTPMGHSIRISYKYDYTGNPMIRHEQYIVGSDTTTVEYHYSYDHRSRIIGEKVSINGILQTDITNTYNDLGQLSTVQAANRLRTTYKYNIQGWLTHKSTDFNSVFISTSLSVQNDNLTASTASLDSDHTENSMLSSDSNGTFLPFKKLFEQKLEYFDPTTTAPLYSGNIAEISWTRNSDLNNSKLYAYSYDKFSRLTDAELYKYDSITGSQQKINSYTERNMQYDDNGNILNLTRVGNGEIVNAFTYTYSGNQLTSLTDKDSVHSYDYDIMGNMIYDGMNNIKISYNYLNLIENVSQESTVIANYSYLWDGTKLSATNADGNGLYYIGSLVYKSRNGVLSLESVAFNGGRIIATSTAEGINYSPQYHLTDHLGSVRAIVDSSKEVIEYNDYYPFGLRWDEGQLSDNRYRYNGKEEQAFVNVPYSDYGARMLDSKYRLGWNGVDELSEETPGISPFAFCNNNPLRFVDHFGLQAEDTLKVNKIEPVVVTGRRVGITLNTAAYYMLPMVSFNDAAGLAAQDGHWGAYVGNVALGTLEGLAFYATLGYSNQFAGYLKMSIAMSKIAKAVKKIDSILAVAGKFERLTHGVRQAVIKGGNIEKAFSSLVEGSVRTGQNTFRLADGTYVTKYNSSTNGLGTIHIKRPNGLKYKIRYE